MQMEEMVAGRELDALVAEKVMGETHIAEASSFVTALRQRNGRTINHIEPLRRYSTDIAAAWGVVEHLKEQANLTLYSTWQGWTAKFGGYSLEGEANDCETAPLAIVRAALAAVASFE